ncbi:hypothetical protein ABEY43_07120 [Priestia megaterium]
MLDKHIIDAIKDEISKTYTGDAVKSINKDFDMNSDDFKESMKKLKAFQEQMAKRPIGIKANQEWFDKQVKDEVIIVDGDFKGMNKQLALFTGLPFRIDNTVDSYEFVYREEERYDLLQY